ncbi:sulfatase-like hydrolase/transferase [Luteolibacter sp. Populi]|uniref:sulfatase-like hydrolase/transferase n=1 Tax=Luteolibacter sp. Populi TaxID=3230487 RepID=UPI003464F82F
MNGPLRRPRTLLSACFVLACGTLPGADRPNIVYILADDLGYGDVASYNAGSKIPTPELDKLAKQGRRFTDAHSPSSVCTPTRYALLTGRYAWRSPQKTGVLSPWGRPLIDKDRLTIATFLKQNGYRTAAIGKWHLGWTWPTHDGQAPASGQDRLSNVDFTKPVADGPVTRGFDYYFGVDVPNYPPYVYIENDRVQGIPSVTNRPEYNRPGPMLPGWDWGDVLPEITRRAEHYIEDSAKRPDPFFLYLPLTSPHYPVVPTAEFKGKSGAGDYGDFVMQTDWTVGRILDALDRSGAAANTLVIFTSDNGPEVSGEVRPGVYDRIRQYGHSSAGPLRGAKRDLWEGGHRVPFLTRWPGKIPAGTVSTETISHVDLFATVAALLEKTLPPAAAPDSFNILPALRDEPTTGPLRPATVHHGINGSLAIRRGDWVLIDAPSGDLNREPEWRKEEWKISSHQQPAELFNLKEDPQQRSNRYADQPALAAELKALLDQYRDRGRSTPGPDLQNDPASPSALSNTSREGPWKSGDLLAGNDAPKIARRPLTISATIKPTAADGVVLAQGGARHGLAIYLKQGRLIFATRVDATLKTVSAPAPPLGIESRVEGVLSSNGKISLLVDGKEAAAPVFSGFISDEPGDPLSVGRDTNSPVGEYESPFPFQGSVENATLRSTAP